MQMGNAIVTGGARGIGAAAARKLADRGHSVCVNYRQQDTAAKALVESIARQGGRALAVKADVSCEEQVAELFDTAASEFGRIDMLVNNAGIIEKQSRLQDMGVERFRRVFDVNVTGTFLCTREAVKWMSTEHLYGYPRQRW